MDHLIIHYGGEIGSKGANRKVFEKKLRDNVRSLLRQDYETIGIQNSRLVVKLHNNADKNSIMDRLKYTPGISFFAFAQYCEKELIKIKETIFRNYNCSQGYNIKIFIPKKDNITFETLKDTLKNKYNIHSSPLFIEVLNTGCYIYDAKNNGIGGLPVGVSGKLISLISGGIDSPVAAYKMYTRGCSISFVHFYNPTQHKHGVITKITDLVTRLSKYQFKTRLYVVKFDNAQQEIIKNVPSSYRMIIYRRLMFKIGEKILEKENAKGFITGDSLAQVASQTIENLSVIHQASKYPVLAPLIGESKDSIIQSAKEIGTYETSIQPYSDCCSYFIAQHPETRSTLDDINKIEKNINVNEIIKNAIKNTSVSTFMS